MTPEEIANELTLALDAVVGALEFAVANVDQLEDEEREREAWVEQHRLAPNRAN